MLRTEAGATRLGPQDLPAVLALLAADPVVNVFTEHRARSTRLDPRLLGGEVWGYHEDGELVSVCHAAANLAPAQATPAALEAFAAKAGSFSRRSATIVGLVDDVTALWDHLRTVWPPAREERMCQPHLEIREPSHVPADPGVRRAGGRDLGVLYPACVSMYTEELGVSPEEDGGAAAYRARLAQLIGRGWSFVRVEDGKVVFKAEVAAATPSACQIQGVWVTPERRGEGLGAAGMAAVVETCLREVAPVVSLYVNDYNVAARRTYEQVGFTQTATFATVML